MKKILFYARDPGAANCIIPVYEKVKKNKRFQTLLSGKDFALNLYKNENLPFLDIAKKIKIFNKKNVKEFLRNSKIDVVVSGVGSTDITDRIIGCVFLYPRSAAKKTRI